MSKISNLRNGKGDRKTQKLEDRFGKIKTGIGPRENKMHPKNFCLCYGFMLPALLRFVLSSMFSYQPLTLLLAKRIKMKVNAKERVRYFLQII